VVELRYRPPYLGLALAWTLAGLLGLGGLWWRASRQARTRASVLRAP
jgi:hypothetical protein